MFINIHRKMHSTIQINHNRINTKVYQDTLAIKQQTLKCIPSFAILVLFSVLSGTTLLVQTAQSAQAETLIMPQESSTLFSIKTPTRGMTMQQVRQTFGKPQHVIRSQGQVKKDWPRITCWDYKDFSVYFERKLVLHSVLKPNN